MNVRLTGCMMETMMSMVTRKAAVALGLAGAVALSSTTASFAGSVPTSTAAVKAAVEDGVTQVRWRGRGAGPAVAAGIVGLAAGAMIGAAANSYYYGPGYVYDPGYTYAPGYAYGPGYGYAPAPYAYGPVYAPAPAYYRGFSCRNQYDSSGVRVRFDC
jgi:hypothetical protein